MPTAQSVDALTTAPSVETLDPVVRARLRRTQVALNVRSVRLNAYSMPIWAMFLSGLFSMSAPIGYTPWTVWWVWPAACVLVALAAHFMARNYRVEVESDNRTIERWYQGVLGLHLAVGIAWGIGMWVHWHEANAANHLFLFVIAVCATALYAIVRAGDFNIVLAGTVPLLGSLWIHFLGLEISFDLMLSIILPLWAFQFYRDTQTGCAAMLAAHVMRIEKERLTEDLLRARDEAQEEHAQAVRANASKTKFLANMSHELRTPLNAILGFSEVISTEAFGPNAYDRYKEYAGDIRSSGMHLLSLINDLLDVAKIEAGKLELDLQWTDGPRLVEDCVRANQEHAMAKGLVLSTAFHPLVTKIFVDERAFKQIVLNLISNAIKFTDEGGGVLVQLKPAPGGIELAVKDTGCGIPAALLQRVFEPFEQVDNRYTASAGGTGLGLTLVRALAELQGGKCTIESEVGRGTTVHVVLPFPSGQESEAPRTTALSA